MAKEIKYILLAEDDRATAHLVKRKLELQGFSVMTAGNGREALDIVRSQEVDLLITDVVMPEMDGVDLYLELKKSASTVALPIIIVTDKQVFLDSFAALGVDHFVPKTSDFEVLLDKIREIGSFRSEEKNYRKVLISAQNKQVAQEMQGLLQGRSCLAIVVESPIEIVSKALIMMPHIILLDLMMHEEISVNEIVRSLRCYDRLKKTAILTFIDIPPDQFEDVQDMRARLESIIEECQKAGATKYLGQFSRGSFLSGLKEFDVE